MSSVPQQEMDADHLLRAPAEIERVLNALASHHAGVTAQLEAQGAVFATNFLFCDPAREFIMLAASLSRDANAALVLHQRLTFVATLGGWRVEFVASDPRETIHEGQRAVRLRYPEILSAHQRRAHPRIDVATRAPLLCVADAAGIMPFDAQLIDISAGGIGVLQHALDITLEPGTMLLGCRIEVPGSEPVIVDLEARYSEIVTLPDGTRARRSGFRFLDGPRDLKTLLEKLGAEP